MATRQVLGPPRTAEESGASFIHKYPTMELLSRLVVPRVSSRWNYIGLQLGMSPERLEVIEGEHRRKEDCCTALFTDWLRGPPGTGSKQRSWESVLSAVETGHGTEAQTEIREGLKEAAAQSDHQPADVDDKAWFSTNPLVQKYLDRVRDTYNEMSVTGEYPHLDYIKLRVIRSQPSQHKREDTIQFLRNFQRATVDFISQQDTVLLEDDSDDDSDSDPDELSTCDSVDDIADEHATGLLSHDHFLQQQEKPLHIVFGPPGVGKTSFSRHICSQFNSAPQSSSFSLVLLFFLREKRVAEAKSLSDLLSCYGLPDDDLDHKELARMIVNSKGKGIQLIFDGLDECQDLLKDKSSIFTRLLSGELKEAQVVVTSRPGIVTQLSTLWHRASLYEVQGFSPHEVKQYTESFFLKDGDPSAAPKLLSALADRPDLTGSTYIPLNLWLICSVFSFKNYTLPDTLTQCYTALFAQLLQRQAMKEGLETAVGSTLDKLPASMLATLDCLSQLSYLCYLKEELVFDEEVVISTCLSSRAELKTTFDGMSLLHVHPKKHGVKDHLTFNFLHSTYQEYLCARHIVNTMSEEEQTAFWKENINNPRFAMVFRFYCGLSQLQVRGVQEIVKGQKLPSRCDDTDRRLLFLFYSLHESSNTHLTGAIASLLNTELTFELLLSPYDFYVMQYCLNKTAHLRRMRFPKLHSIYQSSESAIHCISSVASTNAIDFLESSLANFTLCDAQHLTKAKVALEDVDLFLRASHFEALEHLLFIPTLKRLKLDVETFSDLQTTSHPKSMLDLRVLDLTFPPDGAGCLGKLIHSCPQLKELTVQCDSEGAGDVVAATLPNLRSLKKVMVKNMNPVPLLQAVGLCGKLEVVVVNFAKHCEPTTEEWSKVSASFATAQHLKKVEVQLEISEINFLRSCLSSLTYSQSLQELVAICSASCAGDVVAAALPNLKCLRKVTVQNMNPVPVLQTVGLCGKLQEVSVQYPNNCVPTTERWSKVSSSLATAQHLKKVELVLGEWPSDISFLRYSLSSLSFSQCLQDLVVYCKESGAGDVVAAALPNMKCLKKVTVWEMNPVPALQTVGLCGKLQEVSVCFLKHCEPTTEEWSKVSSSLATAQHLKKVYLQLGYFDFNFLWSCLSSLSHSQSLQELFVECNASGAGDVVAAALPNVKCLRKVTVCFTNPLPVLQTVGLCENLKEVSVWHPKHCKPTTEEWSKVSSSMATAQHLKKVELVLEDSDINFLQSCLSSLSYSQSLQELNVYCAASSAGYVLADSVLSLRSVEKLFICDLNPVPVLQAVSQQSEHCSVSTLGIALEYHPELVDGVSDMLAKCKSIRAFELYLNEGPESLAALNSCLEGVCHSSSIESLSISCLNAAAGPAVAQLLPNVVGHLVKLSVSLPDSTDVLEVLQDSSVASLTLVMSHLRQMTPHDQLRLKTLLSGVQSGQVSTVFQRTWQFPYDPWIDPDISPGLPETLCVCTGLSANPHIRGAEVSGVPPGILSEVQCLLMNNPSCHSITVNEETLRQVEPSDDQSSDEESFVSCGDSLNSEQERDSFHSCEEGVNTDEERD